MSSRSISRAPRLWLCCLSALLLTPASCPKKVSTSQTAPVEVQVSVKAPFRFVAYGDSRFHDPNDLEVANPPVRMALVQAVAEAHPSFVCFTGDLVYNGYDANDWKVWDSETAIWREKKIPVFPALGNHEFHGDLKTALGNYFERFPDLKQSRYYSVRAANSLLLALDSSLDETTGEQGEWLAHQLDNLPAGIDFVFVMMHHPPYTSSSDDKRHGGGHAARAKEQVLAKMLEERQSRSRQRFVVFSGHVHNYERHEHSGVTYFVSGGGEAHAYPIERAPGDLFQSDQINYHYLLVEVEQSKVKVTMNRVEMVNGKASWSTPDRVEIDLPAQSRMEPVQSRNPPAEVTTRH